MFGGGAKPIGGGALAPPPGPYGSYGPGTHTQKYELYTCAKVQYCQILEAWESCNYWHFYLINMLADFKLFCKILKFAKIKYSLLFKTKPTVLLLNKHYKHILSQRRRGL